MRKVTTMLWAAAIVVMGSQSARAQSICIRAAAPATSVPPS